jgi:hypothetical protein
VKISNEYKRWSTILETIDNPSTTEERFDSKAKIWSGNYRWSGRESILSRGMTSIHKANILYSRTILTSARNIKYILYYFIHTYYIEHKNQTVKLSLELNSKRSNKIITIDNEEQVIINAHHVTCPPIGRHLWKMLKHRSPKWKLRPSIGTKLSKHMPKFCSYVSNIDKNKKVIRRNFPNFICYKITVVILSQKTNVDL